ncbi:hypothetical protein K2X96_00995 [Patescibacteria group bacterium]|nr:hypothetical protein [Patescibacteria group bacterium]
MNTALQTAQKPILTRDQTDLVEYLMCNKQAFDDFVYTPWQEALRQLDVREYDASLDSYINQTLPDGIPEIMRGKRSMVILRNLATPNFEFCRFMISADSLSNLNPLILEFKEDKFADVNELKRALGKLPFYKGLDSSQRPIVEYRSVIDMSHCNGKHISSLKTSWGESFSEFHRAFFLDIFPNMNDNIYDFSEWVLKKGNSSKDWYKSYFCLFLRNNVLFENFITTGRDGEHTREVVLPAILDIFSKTGMKPLIIALEPTNIEGDTFWLSYPGKTVDFVDKKMISK